MEKLTFGEHSLVSSSVTSLVASPILKALLSLGTTLVRIPEVENLDMGKARGSKIVGLADV